MIAAAAACKVTRNDAELTQIDVISGTVTFDVSPRQPGSLFEVRANEVVVRVIGTRFDVSLEPDGAVSVVVEHGVVRVQRGVDPPTTLRAGDALRLVSSESLAVSDSLSPVEEGEDSLPTEVAAEGGETLSEVNKQAPDEPAVLDEQPEETSAAVDPPVGDRTRERARRTASASTRAVRERRRRAAARRQARLEARAASRSTNVAKPVASADTLAQPAPAAESVTSAPSSTNNEVPNAASVSVTREAVEAPEESDSVEVEVAVDAVRESDPAGEELKQIFRQLDGVSYGRSIQDIRRWLENHPRHRHRADARYAIGYCEYKRGNQERAREIFGSLEGSRWIRDIGDIFREPVRPR